jgi:hypothetical protein
MLMSGSLFRTVCLPAIAVAWLAGCTGSPPETLTAEQQAAQVAEEQSRLADEDQAEKEFQKSQRKSRR